MKNLKNTKNNFCKRVTAKNFYTLPFTLFMSFIIKIFLYKLTAPELTRKR